MEEERGRGRRREKKGVEQFWRRGGRNLAMARRWAARVGSGVVGTLLGVCSNELSMR